MTNKILLSTIAAALLVSAAALVYPHIRGCTEKTTWQSVKSWEVRQTITQYESQGWTWVKQTEPDEIDYVTVHFKRCE